MRNLIYRIYRKLAYILWRIYVYTAPLKDALNHEERKTHIIVSLTSYPGRFAHIHTALKSIMLQTVKPDKIIVWLDEDVERDKFTPKMLELEQYGIEYRMMPGDLKPHKKYFHAMQEYPDDIIITVDDDLIYPKDVIESLLKTHERYPKAVCARRVHKITKKPNGEIAPYNDWLGEYCGCDTPSHTLVATGVGGVLYPPHCLYEKTFDEKLIMELSLKADDIWLKFMEYINNVPVVYTGMKPQHPQQIKGTRETGLFEYNKTHGINDLCIKKLKMVLTELGYLRED